MLPAAWRVGQCQPASQKVFCFPFPQADNTDGPGRCWGTCVYLVGASKHQAGSLDYAKWGACS